MKEIILISDDSIDKDLEDSLLKEYEVISLNKDADIVQEALQIQPQAIILDVKSKKITLKICGLLKSEETTQDFPLIVLSENTSSIECFEAGADDYLLKPVTTHQLESKILFLLHMSRRIKELKSEQHEAVNTAMEALRCSSDFGQAIHFLDKCSKIDNEEQLANELINACDMLNLKVVVSVLKEGQWFIAASNSVVTPLMFEVLPQLHGQGRFIDFGRRTQINYPNVSILVRNMPIENPLLYGRIKDLLPHMLRAVDFRLRSVSEVRAIQEQTELMSRSFNAMFHALESINNRMTKLSDNNKVTMEQLLEYMFLTIPKLALEDDQESFILSSLDKIHEFSQGVTEESNNIRDNLSKINQLLEALMKKQNSLDQLAANAANDVEFQSSDETDSSIDLF